MLICSTCKKAKPLGDFPKGRAVCKLCKNEREREYSRNPKTKEKKAAYYKSNKDLISKQQKIAHQKRMEDPEYRDAHNSKRASKEYTNNYYASNTDAAKVRMKKYCSSDKGKAVRNSNWKKRQTQKMQAMPSWANQGYIRLFYEGAKIEAERIGEPVDVDHIVPLQHPLVCGLHCEQNLQLLIHKENLTKSNTFLI